MILLPQEPKISKKGENRAIFEISGLCPGYGITIGNSLRRVLLSSLEGAAITQVKIKDVPHEFSTIPGVLEDVIFILLNLKKLRFKMFDTGPQKAILKVKGEKDVKASDFDFPSQVEILNKNAPIASLTSKKSVLEMEIQIEKGIGYETAESRKKGKAPIGVIHLDAIYTPIKKVAMHIEDMRVGKRTDFDRLILDIETDGILTPEQAFERACKILVQHFSVFLKRAPAEKKAKEEPAGRKKEKDKVVKKKKPASALKIKIEDFNVSKRTTGLLLDNKVKTVAGLVKKNEKDILAFKGMGEKGLKEIKKKLKKLGLTLKV